MFVADEIRLELSFAVARERLARLSESGALFGASEDAYAPGLTRVGAAGLSKLIRVQARELSWTDKTAALALRWEATGAGSGLFPVLDADLRLAPDGAGTMLTLAGAYRPPLGPLGQALDRALLHRVADATVRTFVGRVAAQLTGHPVALGTDLRRGIVAPRSWPGGSATSFGPDKSSRPVSSSRSSDERGQCHLPASRGPPGRKGRSRPGWALTSGRRVRVWPQAAARARPPPGGSRPARSAGAPGSTGGCPAGPG